MREHSDWPHVSHVGKSSRQLGQQVVGSVWSFAGSLITKSIILIAKQTVLPDCKNSLRLEHNGACFAIS